MPTFGGAYDAVDANYEWGGFSCRLRIRQNLNTQHRDALYKARRPYKRKAERGELTAREEEEVLCKGLAEGVLIGWDEEAMSAAVGEPYPYSVRNAVKLLLDDMNIRNFVLAISQESALYQQEEVEALQEKH